MKKLLSSVLAAAMVASIASVSVFAATRSLTAAVDGDGDAVADITVGTRIDGDPVVPGKTFYVPLGLTTNGVYGIGSLEGTASQTPWVKHLVNKDYFKFKLDKDEGSKYIKSVTLYTDKNLESDSTNGRTSYLKFELNDSQTTSELKATGEITFTAKATSASYAGTSKAVDAGSVWADDTVISIPYTLWINNKAVKGADGSADLDERIYFETDANEENTMIWGDDYAALQFDSTDGTNKFYARLSNKSDAAIWADYADPVDADIWFFDFKGSASIPATSRATLTLGIPWDEDKDYAPDPEDVFIYEKDADGYLIDVTSKFSFSEDDAEIPGWSIKTRTLGTYIISDTELDLDVYDDDDDVSEAEDVDTNTGAKPIPDTGASDMVNVAVVAGIVSLAAAGAVAFRKAK